MRFLHRIYTFLTWLLFPFAGLLLRRGHEEGFDERCGIYPPGKLKGLSEPVLWIHAVSVGEVQAAFPLLMEFKERGYRGTLIVSTVTVTGKKMAETLMPQDTFLHVFAPWDAPQSVERALDALRPSAYITLETEVWPNLLRALNRRNIPAFLANARVSDRVMKRSKGWKKGLQRYLLRYFTAIYAREPEDYRRLLELGANRGTIELMGDCKIDALMRRRDLVSPDTWLRSLAIRSGRILFLAGSTHEGEETVVLEAFKKLKRQTGTDAGLILVPRHPQRASALVPLAREAGVCCTLSHIRPGWDILIADRIGVLFELYSLVRSAFIGGSLVPKGGQNLLEAVCWGIPVQHGPYMDDFAAPARELGERGIATQVNGADDLYKAWDALLSPNTGEGQKDSQEYFALRSGAAARICEKITERMNTA